MSTRTDNGLADALRDVLTSPNVPDSNMEPANIVDALDDLSRGIWFGLGPKGEPPARRPNSIEIHSEAIREAGASIASAIHELAAAIRQAKT